MDDPRWLRLITLGLVLAALAVGYFLITGRFTQTNLVRTQSETNQVVSSSQPTIIPESSPTIVLGQNTQNIPSTPQRTGSSPTIVTTLPRTGNPQIFLGIIAIGVMISGLGLRKFPH